MQVFTSQKQLLPNAAVDRGESNLSDNLGSTIQMAANLGLFDEVARWQADRWWRDEEYVQSYQLAVSPKFVDECVSAVLRVFNKKWVLSNLPHPAFFEVFSRGIMPLNAAIALGRNLLLVRNLPGFNHLARALRDPGNYESAKLELALAALYCDSGYEIALHPTTQKSKKADLLTRCACQEVLFEAKIVRESDESLALRAFTTHLATSLNRLLRSGSGEMQNMHYQVRLDDQIAKSYAKRMATEPRLFAELVSQTSASIQHYLDRNTAHFVIPRIGDFIVAPKEAIPDSRIIGPPIDSHHELGRLLGSRLRGAIRQLDHDRAGIVVFRTAGILEELPSNTIVEAFLREEGQRAAHVSAIIFLPVFYWLPTRWSPFNGFAVVNPFGRFPASSLHAFRTLVDQCSLTLFDSL
jgi:hypothetical protein